MKTKKIQKQTFNWADEVIDLDDTIKYAKLKADDNQLVRLIKIEKLDRWKQEIIYLYAMYQSFNKVAEIIGISRETVRLYYNSIIKEIAVG